MKILKRALITIGAIIGVLALGIAALVGFVAYRGARYYDFVETGGPIEAQYTPMGPHEVSPTRASRADRSLRTSGIRPTSTRAIRSS